MMCGIGGTGRLILYAERSREYLFISASGRAGSLARPDTFDYTNETSPGRSLARQGPCQLHRLQGADYPDLRSGHG